MRVVGEISLLLTNKMQPQLTKNFAFLAWDPEILQKLGINNLFKHEDSKSETFQTIPILYKNGRMIKTMFELVGAVGIKANIIESWLRDVPISPPRDLLDIKYETSLILLRFQRSGIKPFVHIRDIDGTKRASGLLLADDKILVLKDSVTIHRGDIIHSFADFYSKSIGEVVDTNTLHKRIWIGGFSPLAFLLHTNRFCESTGIEKIMNPTLGWSDDSIWIKESFQKIKSKSKDKWIPLVRTAHSCYDVIYINKEGLISFNTGRQYKSLNELHITRDDVVLFALKSNKIHSLAAVLDTPILLSEEPAMTH